MILERFQVLINVCRIIQNLQFHAYIRGIALHRGAYTQAIIGTRCQLKFETENKVTVLIFRI